MRELLIDCRTLSAGLKPTEKQKLQDDFNDPDSSLQVLVLIYDVSFAGLNLHVSCSRVILAATARSFGPRGTDWWESKQSK